MLKHRVVSGILMAGALLAALYFLPPEGAVVVLALFCALGLWEFSTLLAAGGIPHFRWTGIVGGIVLLVSTWWFHDAESGLDPDVEAMVLFGIAAVVFIRQMFQPIERALQGMAATLLGMIYVAWLFNFLNKLLLVFGFTEGRLLIFYLALVVKLTDVGAFFVGCRLGGKKFFPRISPAKTWSGVVGGMTTGVAFSVLGWLVIHPMMPGLNFLWYDALILGVLLSAAGIAGDLIESMVKRASGVKDSGTIIKGMGGFLDVVDSLMFTAPILYIYMRLFVETVGS
jgi:phosphatidate cytidylyltransferase